MTVLKVARVDKQGLSVCLALLFAWQAMPVSAQVAGADACGPLVYVSPSSVLPNPVLTLEDEATYQQNMALLNTTLVCLINAERSSRGLPELTVDATLQKAAGDHASEAVRIKWWNVGNSHENPETGSTIESRIRDAGYCMEGSAWTSENTFNGYGAGATAYSAVDWWMNVSIYGHREAILDPDKQHIGTGVAPDVADPTLALDPDVGTWVVDFGLCQAPQNEPIVE
jgi:uncharacterized protein YkwD